MKVRRERLSGGFTIVELLIATAMFSVVVLVALSGFVEIGRIFFKGNVLTATQQSIKNVTQTIASDVGSTASVTAAQPLTVGQTAGTGVYYICIGSVRYSYSLSQAQPVNLSANPTVPGNVGIIRDKPNLAGGGCPAPTGANSPSATTEMAELLSDRMRLNQFCVSPNAGANKLFDINIDAVTGNGNVLKTSTNSSPSNCTGLTQYDCNSALNQSQYCARADLKNTVSGGRVQ